MIARRCETDWLSSETNRRRCGYTLIEILVVIAILATLISILLPTLGKTMETARGFQCQLNQRSTAFDFIVFADSTLHGDRGDDDRNFGPNRFSIETFMESQYCVDEFWCYQGQNIVTQSASNGRDDVMRCPEVKGDVTLRRNTPCRDGAVGPVQNISYAFNARLFRAETIDHLGRPRTNEVQMTSNWVSKHPQTPLVWDADGVAAANAGVSVSVFSAPSLDSQGPYANDQYWWPGNRHGGRANYALFDGSVHSTSTPLLTGWDWSSQPIN